MEFRLVIGNKEGKCSQVEIKDDKAQALIGKKIGDTIEGETIGLPGYKFLLTGGSDYCGFPMRQDVNGGTRGKILAIDGIGLTKLGAGVRQRKTVASNTIHDKSAQINLKILTVGSEPLTHTPAKKKK